MFNSNELLNFFKKVENIINLTIFKSQMLKFFWQFSQIVINLHLKVLWTWCCCQCIIHVAANNTNTGVDLCSIDFKVDILKEESNCYSINFKADIHNLQNNDYSKNFKADILNLESNDYSMNFKANILNLESNG